MNFLRRVCFISLLFACSGVVLAQCGESEDVHSVPTRPTFSTGAETTQCGVVEFDAGATFTTPSGARYWSVGDSTRLGITDHLDMRVASDSIDHLALQNSSVSGIGDLVLNPKYRFNKESRWMPSFAAAYAIKLPTADAALGLGTGQRDQVFSFLASKSLGKYHVDFNASALKLGLAPQTSDYAAAWSSDVSCALTRHWSVVADLYSTTFLDDEVNGTALLLVGGSYQVNPRLYIDAAVDSGFTPGSNERRLQFGVTYAAGRLFGHRK
jgi:Putative MetA-pathway of phenol degradation